MATQIDGTAPTVPAELPPDETLCVKCGMAEPEGLGNVCKSSGVQCKLCTSVYQLLYRHLGSMPAALQSLSATQQKEFFKQSGSLLQSAPKNGRWSLVKGAMVKEITSYREELTKSHVEMEYVPLSVWAQRGFDTALIQANGQQKEDAVLWS